MGQQTSSTSGHDGTGVGAGIETDLEVGGAPTLDTSSSNLPEGLNSRSKQHSPLQPPIVTVSASTPSKSPPAAPALSPQCTNHLQASNAVC